jgi:hypothetical protein
MFFRGNGGWRLYALLTGLALLMANPISARGASLTPPSPPGARCAAGSHQTICFFSFVEIFDNEPLFGFDGKPMTCLGTQLVESGPLAVDVKRTYDSDGMLFRIQRHLSGARGEFTIGNPATGMTIANPGHWTETYELTERGVLPPVGTLTITGNFFQITAPHSGAIYFDVGRIVFAPNGDVSFEAGPKAFFDGESLDSLCNALE